MAEQKKSGASWLVAKFKDELGKDPRAARLLNFEKIDREKPFAKDLETEINSVPPTLPSTPVTSKSFSKALEEYLTSFVDFEEEYRRHQKHPITLPSPNEMASAGATLGLSVANGIARQYASNIKKMSKETSFYEVMKNRPLEVFTKGLVLRMASRASGIIPALMVREKLTKEGTPQLAVLFGASMAETIGRFPAESLMIKKAVKEKYGAEVNIKQLVNMGHRSFYPFFLRNSFMWVAVNNTSEEISDKIVFGSIAGVLATPFETFGKLVVKHSSESNSISDCYQKAFDALKEGERKEVENLVRNLFRNFPLRGAVGAISAVLLAPQSEINVAQKIKPFFEGLEEFFIQKGFCQKNKEISQKAPSSQVQNLKGESLALNAKEESSSKRIP